LSKTTAVTAAATTITSIISTTPTTGKTLESSGPSSYTKGMSRSLLLNKLGVLGGINTIKLTTLAHTGRTCTERRDEVER
jgi:hypothetical protein